MIYLLNRIQYGLKPLFNLARLILAIFLCFYVIMKIKMDYFHNKGCDILANNENLVSLATRTTKERREIGIKGGIASGKARREKATMLNTLEKLLDEKSKSTGQTYREMATLGLIHGAIRGDSKNYQVIQEMTEKSDKLEEQKANQLIRIPAYDMGRAFLDVYRDIKERNHLEYWLKGGRGSVKSSFWSELLIEELEEHKNMCAIIIRQVANTLKDSAYSQTEWGIDKLCDTYPFIREHWKSTKNPLEITHKETGQKIYFRGADDPGKIKSIKPPKDMYIGIIIYEEFDQIKGGMDAVRKIDQSVVRGGDDFVIIRVYNTPRSSRHFVNVEARVPKENRLIHRSTYLDVPVKWLGQTFFDEAEHMKNTNLKIYENEYLGLETGDGGNVFENLELREITNEEIQTFDYTYMGLDFGWFPDPLAWTKMSYNPNQKILYIYDEFVVNKMKNEDVWEYLKENKGVTNEDLITADSAENKSIGDFKSYGAFMKGAIKGPGSVNYSMKWLASLTKIIIDPSRCPRSAKEFSEYEYEKDKDENFVSSYPDKDNHTIDSVRYALEDIWKKKGY